MLQQGESVAGNSNLQQLIALQTSSVLGGRFGLTEGYTTFVGDIAVQTSQAKTIKDGSQTLFDYAETARNANSGVNLDEEAANLLRFQQLYSANAQVISVSRQAFNTLLSMF